MITLKYVLGFLLIGLLAYLLCREEKMRKLEKRNVSFLESLHLTGLPIISFTNNDKIINLVLDTGCNTSLINSEILKDLDYKTSELKNSVIGIGGESEESNYVLISLQHRGRKYEMKCLTADISETVTSIKEAYGVTIHGVLGTDFFTQYKYILDFNEMIAYSLKKK